MGSIKTPGVYITEKRAFADSVVEVATAVPAFIGYTEMASILGTGTMWIKVPETIKVVIDGELPENVMSKDIILRLIGDC